jgi:hypothetical protein
MASGEYPETMRRGVLLATTVVLGATGGALLGGCGSGTKTVSVSSAPPSSLQTPTTTTSSASTQSTTTSSTSQTTTSTGSSATRSASEPAFVQPTGKGAPAAAQVAEQTLRAHGFTASDPSDYRPQQTLAVLVGTNAGSGDGYDQRAFFFLDGKYIGTDSSQPSAGIHVVSQSDTEITLAYTLYRPHDSLCCPGGGQARVRFQLNNGKLTPLDPIPPINSTTGTSRQ